MVHICPVGIKQVVLNVLFFREAAGGPWVAQGLEKDIAAQGETIEAAKTAFERTVFGYLTVDRKLGREALSCLRPAPEAYWEAYKRVSVEKRFAQMDAP